MRRKPTRLKRRKFIGIGLTAASGGLASCGRSGGGPYWRFFTEAEARTIDAICEQIIPADDFPGARAAGVVNFIDLQLSRHYRKHREAYRNGVTEVDTLSSTHFGKPFADLASEQQVEILLEMESKESEFFGLVLAHTMQGFYGDPRHGGNRGEVSWKMLGLPSPPVRGRVPYEPKAG
jgi:gluconate 2-dehydrogenase gamma chain